MKIKYEFINGEKTEIEVEESIGAVVLDSRRLESNLDRKERCHCLSIEGAEYEGIEYGDYNTPETELLKYMESERVKKAFDSLSETQRKRLLMYSDGLSINKIAELEGVNPNAAWKSIDSAKKKFIKNF